MDDHTQAMSYSIYIINFYFEFNLVKLFQMAVQIFCLSYLSPTCKTSCIIHEIIATGRTESNICLRMFVCFY